MGYNGWFGSPNYLLDPNIALMQAQQTMSLHNEIVRQNIEIQQKSQELFNNNNYNNLNSYNAWNTPVEYNAWNTVPIAEEPAFVPVDNSNTTSSIKNGHQCRVCGGKGQVEDTKYWGNASLTKWCDTCQKKVYIGHHHKQCRTCGGSGWVSGY